MRSKGSKYGSKKIEVDGIKFDSKEEAKYYLYLQELKVKGIIKNFELQPTYTLIPKFEKAGKKYKACTYTPDFKIYYNDGTVKVIDIKGFSTQQGEMRKKLFDYLYPDITLIWIAYSKKDGGWIEYTELKKVRTKRAKEKALQNI